MTRQAPDSDDQRIVARAAAGDAEAWRQLVECYTPRVFGLLVRQCGDRDLAEEITQAAFVQVVGHIGRYDEKGKFAAWLFRIAMNRLRDEMRRRKRQAKPMDMTVAFGGTPWENSGGAAMQDKVVTLGGGQPRDPLEQVTLNEQVQQLRCAVEQLPEQDREVLYLRHTAGLTFVEIAEALEQPLGTVLARGHRALAKLKKLMDTKTANKDRIRSRQAL